MQVKAEIQLPSSDQRISERFDTQMSAGVRRSGSVNVPAVITDLSTTGFRVEAEERLPLDTVVWVKLGNLSPLMARVVWSEKLVAGCRFSAPLHPTVLSQLVQDSD
jgi:hypothetical protein